MVLSAPHFAAFRRIYPSPDNARARLDLAALAGAGALISPVYQARAGALLSTWN